MAGKTNVQEHLDRNPLAARLDELSDAGDLVLRAFAGTLAAMEEWMHTDGWDQPPHLYVLTRQMATPGELRSGSTVLAVDGVHITVAELPMPDALPGNRVADYLDYMLAKMRKSGMRVPNLLAFAFVSEAWMIEATPEEVERYQHGNAKQSPNRVELRIATGVDTAGNMVEIHRIRDYDDRALLVSGRWHYEMTGAIPEALAGMTETAHDPL